MGTMRGSRLGSTCSVIEPVEMLQSGESDMHCIKRISPVQRARILVLSRPSEVCSEQWAVGSGQRAVGSEL